jgi:hypothetical protein
MINDRKNWSSLFLRQLYYICLTFFFFLLCDFTPFFCFHILLIISFST